MRWRDDWFHFIFYQAQKGQGNRGSILWQFDQQSSTFRLSVPFRTKHLTANWHRTFQFYLIPHVLILTANSEPKSRYAGYCWWLFLSLDVVGGKKEMSEKRMTGAFFPIPKKGMGKRRHIFHIAQDKGKKPFRLWWIVLARRPDIRWMCNGTWKNKCKKRLIAVFFFLNACYIVIHQLKQIEL